MAAYPSFTMQRDGSDWTRDGGITSARATNGALRIRRLYGADKRSFVAVHWLSDAQVTDLENHYAAHKTVSFSLTWPHDGTSYTVVYASAPQYKRMDGFRVATVLFLEV